MLNTRARTQEGHPRLGLNLGIAIAAAILAVLGAAWLMLWQPWDGHESGRMGRSQEDASNAIVSPALVPAHSGAGWSVYLAGSGTLTDAMPVLKWMERRVDLLDHESGVRLASIQLSSYPIAVTRRTAGELLVSDKAFLGGSEAARLLIFDAADNLRLKAEIQLDPNRIGYTSYWPGMSLSADERILFYVTESNRTELNECATRPVANVCDRITIGAVDLGDTTRTLDAVELPSGCQPPPLAKAGTTGLVATCNDGRAYRVEVQEAAVTLGSLPTVTAPTETLEARKGQPTDAIFTVAFGQGDYGTLFADGTFRNRTGGGGSHRAVPQGMRPLLGGDDVFQLKSGALLILFGPYPSVFPLGATVYDPASGQIERTVSFDPARVLSAAPDSSGTGIVAVSRDGTLERFSIANGAVSSIGFAGFSFGEEVSLVP